jgi:hypothetical protein
MANARSLRRIFREPHDPPRVDVARMHRVRRTVAEHRIRDAVMPQRVIEPERLRDRHATVVLQWIVCAMWPPPAVSTAFMSKY